MNEQRDLLINGVRYHTVLHGLPTAVPLLLFATGARQIHLSTLGILQYIAPTIQLLLGIFLYHELFTMQRFVGFSLIWLALLVYSVEGVRYGRKLRLQPTVAP